MAFPYKGYEKGLTISHSPVEPGRLRSGDQEEVLRSGTRREVVSRNFFSSLRVLLRENLGDPEGEDERKSSSSSMTL